MMRAVAWIVLLAGIALLLPTGALACPTCYGANDAPMKQGMDMAILAMLAITAMVLGGIGMFFIGMRRRMNRIRGVVSHTAHVNHKGALEWKNT